VGQEAGEGLLLDWLDFFAQFCERFAADEAQDFGVAPFSVDTAGAEAAFYDAIFRSEVVESLLGLRRVEGEAAGYLLQREGAVGAGVAADEFDDWFGNGFEQRGGNPGWEWDAEAVAVAGAVFDGDEALFSGDAEFEQAAGADQAIYRFEDCGFGDTERQFIAGEVAEAEEEVVQAIGRSRSERVDEALLLLFDLGHGVAVEEFAEICFAEQLAELVLIDGEGLGAAFGQRGVAVIQEICNIAEEQGRGEGRWRACVDDVDAKLALFDAAQGFDEGRHVEDVAEAFAVGFEEHWKAGVSRGNAQ
jgi:hypothetical protein